MNIATLKHAKPQVSPAAEQAPTPAAFAMLSHIGRVRHSNQDACAALPERGVFVVCDGMGGVSGGEVASHLASDAFLNSLSQPAPGAPRRPGRPSATPPPARPPADDAFPPAHPQSRLREAIRAANHAVYHRAQKSRALHGMGTTLVAVLVDNVAPDPDAERPTAWLVHVGDSRCYRFRGNALEQLTVDHSLVEEQIRAGLLSREDAACSPVRNIITRAIGSQPSVEPEIAARSIEPGDLYLLASDGLTRELEDAEIAHILAHNAASLQSACATLIDAANRKGGRDNITVLLLSFA